MKPSSALQFHRDVICHATSRFGLENPRVFGSVRQGLDTEGSDLDLLVDPLSGTTLLDLGALPKKFRDQVLAKARPI